MAPLAGREVARFGGHQAHRPGTQEEHHAQVQVVPQLVDVAVHEGVAHEHGEEARPEKRHPYGSREEQRRPKLLRVWCLALLDAFPANS